MLALAVVVDHTMLSRTAGAILIDWAIWHAAYGHHAVGAAEQKVWVSAGPKG